MSKDIIMIYADKNKNDIGVLQDYSFDECFGDEDNTFELKVQQYNHVCREDYYIYIEFTEYGGVIDRVTSETKKGVVTYSGRTWHGILNSYVIEPPTGQMYRVFNGTANQIIQQMITMFNLGSLFEVDTSLTPNDEVLQIHNFSVRYEKMYDAILRMLSQDGVNGKFLCTYKGGKVKVYTRRIYDYANNEEFDTSQVPFKVGKSYNNVNHLVCLGQGEGPKRAVIHLFTNGKNSDAMTIQPYKLVDKPLEDSDYILDKRNQVMTGFDEMTEIYDYPNAESIINYKQLTTKPSDWESSYYKKYYRYRDHNYELVPQTFSKHFKQLWGNMPSDWAVDSGYRRYYYIENNKFVNVKSLTAAQATPQYIPLTPANGYTDAPVDWYTGYSTYLTWSDTDQAYISVKGVTGEKIDQYSRDQRPNDWDSRYSSYSTRLWNGYEWEYSPVAGNVVLVYHSQDSQPTDWEENWGNYYGYTSDGTWQCTTLEGQTMIYNFNAKGFFPLNILWNRPTWEGGQRFWTLDRVTEAPDWYVRWDEHADTGGIFRRSTCTYAPGFVNDGRFFYKKVDYTPAWHGNGYYWEMDDDHWENIPDFNKDKYYYQVTDRMKELVKGGIERLKSLCDTSSLDVDLELTENYDVGDLVGSKDEVTGIKVVKPILRKIVKIKKDILSIEHQVE